MDTKKIKYWTCPSCDTKNPMQETKCRVCGYDASDDYTQEEIEEMNQTILDHHKEEQETSPQMMLIQIIAILVVIAYIAYQINQFAKKVNKFL